MTEPPEPTVFDGLLPELWRLIRWELETYDDAASRVQLQRTCKAAYALDPGLIRAPGWKSLCIQHPDRQQHVLAMLKEVDAARLFGLPWFETTFRYMFLGDDQSPDWSIDLRWDIPCNGYCCLSYEPYMPINKWHIQLEASHNAVSSIIEVAASTLADLLIMFPTLCFGASEELMKTRILDRDLSSLFVRKAYRHLICE